MFGHSIGRLVESDKRAVLGRGRGVQKAAPQRENLTCTVPSTHKARPHLTGCCVNIHSMMRSQLAQSERPNRETDESAACFFLFSSSPLLARYRSVRSYNYKCQVQVCRFFSLSLIFPLLYLPCSSLHLAFYYLLLLAVWSPSRWPAFLALWFCSGDFHLPPHHSLQIDS